MTKTCVIMAPPIPMGAHIADGFRRIGWNAKLVTFHPKPARGRLNPANWLRTPEVGRDITKRFDYVLREVALPSAGQCRADLLLVCRPDAIGDGTKEAVAKYGGPIAAWVIDSLRRYPSQNALVQFTVADFYLDGADVGGPKGVWLPMGVDGNLCTAVPESKDLDVLFIGNIRRPLYESRREALLELMGATVMARHRCQAIVGGIGRVGRAVLSMRAPFRVVNSLPMAAYVRHIARARVCVNVMPNDSTRIINDAFFLIPGCNTCQLTDKHDYMATWLTPDEHFCWFEGEGMISRLEALLADEERLKKIAQEGRRETLAKHTYTERARTIASRTSKGQV